MRPVFVFLFVVAAIPAYAQSQKSGKPQNIANPGEYVGTTYVGTDPDPRIRFELRRDYGRPVSN